MNTDTNHDDSTDDRKHDAMRHVAEQDPTGQSGRPVLPMLLLLCLALGLLAMLGIGYAVFR